MNYEQLDSAFLETMNDIGRYGFEKYGDASFQFGRKTGNRERGEGPRKSSAGIIQHAKEHGDMYLRNELHDHFKTRKHQLAAIAFNAMMEFYFAGLEEETNGL